MRKGPTSAPPRPSERRSRTRRVVRTPPFEENKQGEKKTPRSACARDTRRSRSFELSLGATRGLQHVSPLLLVEAAGTDEDEEQQILEHEGRHRDVDHRDDGVP